MTEQWYFSMCAYGFYAFNLIVDGRKVVTWWLLPDGTATRIRPDDKEKCFPTREACETALLIYLAASDCDWRPDHVLPEDWYA